MLTDWGAVPYPSWWKDAAQKRRGELDLAVARVRMVVASSPDIVAALIFGSYASGTVGPESDLDLMLIVTADAGDDPGMRHASFARRLGLGVACDLLVYDPDEFDRLVNTSRFVAQALRDGLWIDAATPA